MTLENAQTTHPRRFDLQDTLNKLDGYDLRLLEEINYLSKQQGKKSKTGARYCCPGEAYLGNKIGLARENVSRHITKLSHLGILEVTHRSPIRDKFRTNLYKIRSWIWWRLGKILRSLRSLPNRVTPTSHKLIPMRDKETKPLPEVANSYVQSILKRWQERGA